MRLKQQIIFYLQSIAGMMVSHYIPTKLFWFWIALSLYLGHLINTKNYKSTNMSAKKSIKNWLATKASLEREIKQMADDIRKLKGDLKQVNTQLSESDKLVSARDSEIKILTNKLEVIHVTVHDK